MSEQPDNPQDEPARDVVAGGGASSREGTGGAGGGASGDGDERPDFLEATIVDDGGALDGARRPTWRRLPWGGVLALLLVLLGEQLVLGPFGPWEALGARLPENDLLARSAVVDRQQLAWALHYPKTRPRVVAVGTSRAEAAFRPELIDSALAPELDTYTRAHVRVFPQELATHVDEVLAHEPDLVVWYLSEQELLSPLRLVPAATGGDLDGVAAVAAALGEVALTDEPGVAARTSLLRMVAVGLSSAYRFRPVIGAALTDPWRRFPMALDGLPAADPSWPTVLASGAPRPLDPADEQRLRRELLALFPGKQAAVSAQINQVRSLREGVHGVAKRAIAEHVIARLRAAGVAVLIVEASNHPASDALYDAPGGRRLFLDWAAGLAAADEGVELLTRDAMGRPPAEHFRDLTHLNKAGALRSTIAVLHAASRRLLPGD